jgi:hypothetical protein
MQRRGVEVRRGDVTVFVEVCELIKWEDALDVIFTVSVSEGLQKARVCAHPDARWVCSLFPHDGEEVTRAHVLNVMRDQRNDARALFFRHVFREEEGEDAGTLLRSAAALGYAPAQAEVADGHLANERFRWAQRAGAQFDRKGLYALATCYEDGDGCAQDMQMAAAVMKVAAQLGHAAAQCAYGSEFEASDWRRYHWYGRSALGGYYEALGLFLLESVLEVVALFESGGSGQSVFEIGDVFKALLNNERQAVLRGRETVMTGLDMPREYPQEWSAIQKCMRLRDEWSAAAKAAVDCWVLIGLKTAVVPPEIRNLISQSIWAQRTDWRL